MRNSKKADMLQALPPMLQRVQELEKICALEQPMFDEAWAAVARILGEQFVLSASEVGLARCEEMLKIAPVSGADTEERRRAILFRLNEQLPFTLKKLDNLLALVSPAGEYRLAVDNEQRELAVHLSLYCKPVARLIKEVLERTVPANILWEILWQYNTHAMLAAYTHAELAEKSHYEIREEVFE